MARYTSSPMVQGGTAAKKASDEQHERDMKYAQLRSQNKLNTSLEETNRGTTAFRMAGSALSGAQAAGLRGQEQRREEEHPISMDVASLQLDSLKNDYRRKEETHAALKELAQKYGYDTPQYLAAASALHAQLAQIDSSIAASSDAQYNNTLNLEKMKQDVAGSTAGAEKADALQKIKTSYHEMKKMHLLEAEEEFIIGGKKVRVSPLQAFNTLAVRMAALQPENLEAQLASIKAQAAYSEVQAASVRAATFQSKDLHQINKTQQMLATDTTRAQLGLLGQQGTMLQNQIDSSVGLMTQYTALDAWAEGQRQDDGSLSPADWQTYIGKHRIITKTLNNSPFGLGETTGLALAHANTLTGADQIAALANAQRINQSASIDLATKVGLIERIFMGDGEHAGQLGTFMDRIGDDPNKAFAVIMSLVDANAGNLLSRIAETDASNTRNDALYANQNLTGAQLIQPEGDISSAQYSQMFQLGANSADHLKWRANAGIVSTLGSYSPHKVAYKNQVTTYYDDKEQGKGFLWQMIEDKDGGIPTKTGGLRKLTAAEIEDPAFMEKLDKKLSLVAKAMPQFDRLYGGQYNKGLWESKGGRDFVLDTEFTILDTINKTENLQLTRVEIADIVKGGYTQYRGMATGQAGINPSEMVVDVSSWKPSPGARGFGWNTDIRDTILEELSDLNKLGERYEKGNPIRALTNLKDYITQASTEDATKIRQVVRATLNLPTGTHLGSGNDIYNMIENMISATVTEGEIGKNQEKQKKTKGTLGEKSLGLNQGYQP